MDELPFSVNNLSEISTIAMMGDEKERERERVNEEESVGERVPMACTGGHQHQMAQTGGNSG